MRQFSKRGICVEGDAYEIEYGQGRVHVQVSIVWLAYALLSDCFGKTHRIVWQALLSVTVTAGTGPVSSGAAERGLFMRSES